MRNRNLLEIKKNKRESKSIQLLNTYIAVVSSHKVNKLVTLYTCAYIHSKSQYYQEGRQLKLLQRQNKQIRFTSFPKFNDFDSLNLDFLRLVIDVLISFLQLWTTHTKKKILPSWVCVQIGENWITFWKRKNLPKPISFDFKLP